jgi:hypothetical protein
MTTTTTSDDKIISEDAFYETYKPVPNPFNSNASWDGSMLETFGRELAHVQEVFKTAPDTVWTVLDCDGAHVVGSGFHYVNRVGYIITQVPVEPGQSVATEADPDELEGNLDDEDGDAEEGEGGE